MANKYDSWKGADEVEDRAVFQQPHRSPGKTPLAESEWGNLLKDYLPPKKGSSGVSKHYFVARIPCVSKATGDDIVKLVLNDAWEDELINQLPNLEFIQKGRDPDILESTDVIRLDLGEWVTPASGSLVQLSKEEISPKIVVRIDLEKSRTNTSPTAPDEIVAFWCW